MPATADLFIGLMSGTSADAIDAALVRFEPKLNVVAAQSTRLPAVMRQQIRSISANTSLRELAQLDVQLGRLFASAVQDLLQHAKQTASSVRAIGSHGQTVWHEPSGDLPFSMQIGDPNIIAEQTGITTVADFRRRDIAAGGQGAPLVPAFHQEIFADAEKTRCVLNLGGIANITVLHAGGATGLDTGPANTLLDNWSLMNTGNQFDAGGQWAASGKVQPELLSALLEDPYFSQQGPKSTGPEYFSHGWLQHHLAAHPGLRPEDVQATLLELTVRSVALAVRQYAAEAETLLVCGGGVHNRHLMNRLAELLNPVAVKSTRAVGVDPDFVEACAFAWLAHQRLLGRSGNLPSTTGARAPVVLGGVYSGIS